MINEVILVGEVIAVSQLNIIKEEFPSITLMLKVDKNNPNEYVQMNIRFWNQKAEKLFKIRDELINSQVIIKGKLNSNIYVKDEKEYFNLEIIGDSCQMIEEK